MRFRRKKKNKSKKANADKGTAEATGGAVGGGSTISLESDCSLDQIQDDVPGNRSSQFDIFLKSCNVRCPTMQGWPSCLVRGFCWVSENWETCMFVSCKHWVAVIKPLPCTAVSHLPSDPSRCFYLVTACLSWAVLKCTGPVHTALRTGFSRTSSQGGFGMFDSFCRIKLGMHCRQRNWTRSPVAHAAHACNRAASGSHRIAGHAKPCSDNGCAMTCNCHCWLASLQFGSVLVWMHQF